MAETISTPRGNRFKDLTGQRFGRLTAIEEAGRTGRKVRWRCSCDCGCATTATGVNLRSGMVQSCGCGQGAPSDLVGRRFGRLVVIARKRRKATRGAAWVCDCDCGVTTVVLGHSLTRSMTQSCGCRSRELSAERGRDQLTKHGYSGAPTYRSWGAMIQRCTNPNATSWPRYGGRGIPVCDRWRDSFEAFLEDMGERPEGRSLDRIDNERGYFKGNCQWATAKEQRNNQRKRTHQ